MLPFNSRKDPHLLTACDPRSRHLPGPGPVVSTITVVSSKGLDKSVARLVLSGAAIGPLAVSWWEKLSFLTAWWWVGLVIYPRILNEAGILFFCRRLHVWFRPEPLKKTIGRKADATEIQLERISRGYLRYLVKQLAMPLTVRYLASGISEDVTELMLSAGTKGKDGPSRRCRVQSSHPHILHEIYLLCARLAGSLLCTSRELYNPDIPIRPASGICPEGAPNTSCGVKYCRICSL